MIQILGEYECKLDERGRIKIPSKLLDSLGEIKRNGFIINRGFEKNLAIYPKKVWEQKTKEINQFNIYDKQHRAAIRFFYRGATELLLDNADRVNLPGTLLSYAEIEKDVVLFAYRDFIEVWSKEGYEKSLSDEPDSFGDLTQGIGFGSYNPINHLSDDDL
jgi:MraZ protein